MKLHDNQFKEPDRHIEDPTYFVLPLVCQLKNALDFY